MALDAESFRRISIFLKIPQFILGLVVTGFLTHVSASYIERKVFICNHYQAISFMIISSVYATPCFLLLITTLHKQSAEHLRQTIFEILFNTFAAISHLVVSVGLLIQELKEMNWSFSDESKLSARTYYIAPTIIGFVVSLLYFVSMFTSIRARKALSGDEYVGHELTRRAY